MLTAKNLHKAYQSLKVLKGVDLEIGSSSVTSIIGKSGAGKSTLLHLIGTLDKPDKGEVIIDGQDVNNLSKSKLAKFRNEKIGFVFQFHHLIPEFTALENVAIPYIIKNRDKKKALKESQYWLDFLGLNDRLTHKPAELSGGEQQRVAFARALVNKPLIIFADEPTGNLDTQTSQEIHELIIKLKEELGQSFVVVTHNETLAKMSDRTLIMKDGLIVEEI